MSLNQLRRAQTGKETVDILARGSYSNSAGELVDITAHIAAAREGTTAFPPEIADPPFHNAQHLLRSA